MDTTKATPQVGDVLVSSYGYDATFKKFYKVTKRTAQTVTLQQLNKQLETNGGPSAFATATDVEVGTPFVRKVKQTSYGWVVKVSDYEFATFVWDGTAEYETAPGWY